MARTLDEVGAEIENLDAFFAAYLARRFALAAEAGKIKFDGREQIVRPAVEQARISRVVALIEAARVEGLTGAFARDLMAKIIAECRALQKPPPPIRTGWGFSRR
ncbi:MAG: chorismate mutase [Patescibacteria group bacterium]